MAKPICPACGKSDGVRRSPEPYSYGDLVDTAFFGWLGFWSVVQERGSVLRCQRCGCRFRRPSGLLALMLVCLGITGAAGVGAYAAVSLAGHTSATEGEPVHSLVMAIAERPLPALAAAAAVLLISLLTALILAVRLRAARRALLIARGSLREARGELPGIASSAVPAPDGGLAASNPA